MKQIFAPDCDRFYISQAKRNWKNWVKTNYSRPRVTQHVLQSQPKVSGHPQKKALPRFPSFNVAPMMSTFLSIFFEPAKQHWSGGMGEKGSHCPMLLSEIVWTSYAKYVVSFYVMWISTLLQSRIRAPPVQRWRCTILNKIITAATAVKLHGNRCCLNHVDLNL